MALYKSAVLVFAALLAAEKVEDIGSYIETLWRGSIMWTWSPQALADFCWRHLEHCSIPKNHSAAHNLNVANLNARGHSQFVYVVVNSCQHSWGCLSWPVSAQHRRSLAGYQMIQSFASLAALLTNTKISITSQLVANSLSTWEQPKLDRACPAPLRIERHNEAFHNLDKEDSGAWNYTICW